MGQHKALSDLGSGSTSEQFQPPHLPIYQLLVTIAVPALVALLPPIFTREEVSTTACIITGLALLAVLLTVFIFTIILQLYNESYLRQLLRRDLDLNKKQLVQYRQELHETQKVFERKIQEAMAGMDDILERLSTTSFTDAETKSLTEVIKRCQYTIQAQTQSVREIQNTEE